MPEYLNKEAASHATDLFTELFEDCSHIEEHEKSFLVKKGKKTLKRCGFPVENQSEQLSNLDHPGETEEYDPIPF